MRSDRKKIHQHRRGHQHLRHHDLKSVCSLKNGEGAKIKEILGGNNFQNKAESLGIRVGVKLTKVSSQMMHGPTTIKVGQTQIAIGHRMAKKIILE